MTLKKPNPDPVLVIYYGNRNAISLRKSKDNIKVFKVVRSVKTFNCLLMCVLLFSCFPAEDNIRLDPNENRTRRGVVVKKIHPAGMCKY